ncbi:MAG: VOC family protein [Desertimonas sp.]
MPSTTPVRPTAAFGHVSWLTADLDRFRRFYEDVFGFRTVTIEHPDQMPYRRLASLTDAAGEAVRILAFEVPGVRLGSARRRDRPARPPRSLRSRRRRSRRVRPHRSPPGRARRQLFVVAG